MYMCGCWSVIGYMEGSKTEGKGALNSTYMFDGHRLSCGPFNAFVDDTEAAACLEPLG